MKERVYNKLVQDNIPGHHPGKRETPVIRTLRTRNSGNAWAASFGKR